MFVLVNHNVFPTEVNSLGKLNGLMDSQQVLVQLDVFVSASRLLPPSFRDLEHQLTSHNDEYCMVEFSKGD